MNVVLTPIEARVLGCLLEKEVTTPDYYPLTLNALVNAGNQKSSRNPVMALEEKDVVHAVDSLRDKRLVSARHSSGSRVSKYAHEIQSICDFSPVERAVLCALIVRGPLTPGEVRSSTASLHTFGSLEEVELVLRQLAERGDGPFVAKLARQPGRKEARFAHLFCGDVKVDDVAQPVQAPAAASRGDDDRVQVLEQQLAALRVEIDQLALRVGRLDRPII